MAENTVSNVSEAVSPAAASTSSCTIVATDNPPVFSLAMGTNPLLAPTQWSPWMFNPLLSLQAQQAAALMLGAAGGNQALISPRTVTQLNEAGQIEHRSSPAIQIAGPAYKLHGSVRAQKLASHY